MIVAPHLRLAGAPPEVQRDALLVIVRESGWFIESFRVARNLDLPDWWIVSGAFYNQVWNYPTGRPEMTGVKDIDLFYFDLDISWEAEDAVIARAARTFPATPPIKIGNEARVHLWYEARFGGIPTRGWNAPLTRSTASPPGPQAVDLRLRADDGWDLHAPFGLSDIFGFC
jgi:hypothetical protein